MASVATHMAALSMKRYKLVYTNAKLGGKPQFANIPARDPKHALDIAAVAGWEDAIVLFEVKLTKKETRG